MASVDGPRSTQAHADAASTELKVSETPSASIGKSTMFPFAALFLPVIVIFAALIVINASIRILRQYERGVMFTLGRFSAVRGPGLIFLLPWIQQIVRVDLRTVVMEIPGQDLISRDNVSVKVDAVLYFHVADPEKAIIGVEQYSAATNMLAQTTLRSVLGQHELDEMLSKRAMLNTDVQDILDARTKDWGIEVSAVEIRDIQLTDNMVKAIAKQAEAERDRRAKVIHADAEFQAAQTLTDAATILASVPAAMQLRYLQTLTEVGAENNSTIIFPMPIDIVKPFLDLMTKNAAAVRSTNGHKVPTLSGAV
jgi:regulator of protease activity HflC (stomatin/prohibitin superfamily)